MAGDNKSDVVMAIEELVRKGIVRDSGRRRHGQIVWELTEIGRAHGRDILDVEDKTKH
jgi:DNA-binding MarR family transcriptional regulator